MGNDSVHRLRQLNPSAVILTQHPIEDTTPTSAPSNGVVALLSQFQQGIADPWYVRDSHGSYLVSADQYASRKLNVTQFSPIVNGKRYSDYIVDWITGTVFSSGLWDGFSTTISSRRSIRIFQPGLIRRPWMRITTRTGFVTKRLHPSVIGFGPA